MEKEKTVQRKTVNEQKIETSGYDMFTLVKKDGVVLIAVADKIVSKKTFKSEQEAKYYIIGKPWELLVNVACVCYDLMKKETSK